MARALIEKYYACFNHSDWEGMVALLTEDVIHDINQGPREVGKAAFERFLKRMERSYREQIHSLVVMVNHDGTRAASEYIVDGEYLSSDEGLPEAHGQRYSLKGGAFFALHGGLIARISNAYNLPDWIAQVSKTPWP